MKTHFYFFVSLFLFLFHTMNGQTVTMPNIISSNMVLQQNSQVPIWGWAASGTSVSITPSWGTKTTVVADATGKWKTSIQTPVAVAGLVPVYSLMVAGPSNTLSFTNILVGEVWLTSGQSNMAFAMNFLDVGTNRGVLNYVSEIAAANYPNIRLFDVPKISSTSTQTNCTGTWASCTPTSVTNFSAVAYYFARKLHLFPGLNVPVGIINASYSGSAIQTWMKNSVLTADATLNTKYITPVTATTAVTAQPSGFYNAMIAPIIPYAIKGAIWYQGESNSGDGATYTTANIAMLNDWRTDWGTDFSFYATQLSPRLSTPGQLDNGNARADFREIQGGFTSLTKTGIIPNGDVLFAAEEYYNPHPRNKKLVGERLALMALGKDYAQAVQYLGPKDLSSTVSGSSMIINFDPTSIGSGLGIGTGLSLNCFKISGSNATFYPANAVIVGNTVVVSSPSVPVPVAVRYAYTDGAMTNFQNNDGVAAYPFKTDTWTTATNITATTPAPFVVTNNDGVHTNPSNYYASAGCTATYIQNPDQVTADTVMQFVRNTNATNNFAGPQWSGLNNNAGIDVGTYTATQYNYLVVSAKQSTTTPFFINLQQVGDSATVKTADIPSLITPTANQWVDYVFDVSVGSHIPSTFLMLMLMPEKGLATTTTLINKLYFTNTVPATAFPASIVTNPNYARTATSIDLYWTALPNASSYNVVDGNGLVVKTGITTPYTTVTGLTPNTSYTFKIVGVNSLAQLSRPSVAVTATTRKQKGTNFELVEDFESTVSPLWVVSNTASGTFTNNTSNTVVNGINSSLKCGKITIPSGLNTRNYLGLQVTKERIDVGPNAPFRYLHIKIHRDQDIGGISLNLLARTDITQAQLSFPTIAYTASLVDGAWHDYVFDLKTVSATDLTFYDFLIKVNATSGNPTLATNTYFDDFVLSNDATPLSSNVSTVNLMVSSNNSSWGNVSGGGVSLKGIATTITATPATGCTFVNWTNGLSPLSSMASYSLVPTADMTITANFQGSMTNVNEVSNTTTLRLEGHTLFFEGEGCDVEVYNTSGKLIQKTKVQNSSLFLQDAGAYIVKMKTTQSVTVQKVLVL